MAAADSPALGSVTAGEILGAVLVSQSTARVLASLDQARSEVVRVVLASLVVAVLLNLALAMTIVRPLRRLRREAEGLLDAGGRMVGEFEPSRRHDEIGELRDSLVALAGRLRRQQKTAESFAADVAHEIKGPLTTIRSSAEMLGAVTDEAQRRRLVELIEGSTVRAEDLLSSLRELAAIEAGLEEEHELSELGVVAALSSCELVQLVANFVDSRASAGQGVALETRVDAVRVRGRPERLEQVVANLVDNAIGFSPEDEVVRVTIEADDEEDPSAAVLRVIDRGPGIPERDLETVFQRFYSYRPASGAATSGSPLSGAHTGLGLSIVRSIVEAYGGSVVARNAVGGGAVFECRLPMAQ